MKIVCILLIFAIAEILLSIVFSFLKKGLLVSATEQDKDNKVIEVVKGILERSTLTLGLINGYPQILIFFGALKLGTRLSAETTCKGFNNFFLVGNLITVFIAILYTQLIQHSDKLIGLVSFAKTCYS